MIILFNWEVLLLGAIFEKYIYHDKCTVSGDGPNMSKPSVAILRLLYYTMFLTLANSQRTPAPFTQPQHCEPPGIMAEVGYMDTLPMFWVAACDV
jgi:hypothetical protein